MNVVSLPTTRKSYIFPVAWNSKSKTYLRFTSWTIKFIMLHETSGSVSMKVITKLNVPNVHLSYSQEVYLIGLKNKKGLKVNIMKYIGRRYTFISISNRIFDFQIFSILLTRNVFLEAFRKLFCFSDQCQSIAGNEELRALPA